MALGKVLGYTPYIIQEKNKRRFHAFCQIYKDRKWYYVDARGIISSFDEFMVVASEFVGDEYIIRPVTLGDIEEWKNDSNYEDEALSFAEAVIEKYKDYYRL